MNPTMIYLIDQSYMKPSEKNQCSRSKYIWDQALHYPWWSPERRKVVLQYISPQISKHFGKSSIQDERVCVLKLELLETTSLLKKKEMTSRLGGSTKNIIEDIHFQDWKVVHLGQILSCSESGLRFLMDNNFPLWLTWEVVQTADVS